MVMTAAVAGWLCPYENRVVKIIVGLFVVLGTFPLGFLMGDDFLRVFWWLGKAKEVLERKWADWEIARDKRNRPLVVVIGGIVALEIPKRAAENEKLRKIMKYLEPAVAEEKKKLEEWEFRTMLQRWGGVANRVAQALFLVVLLLIAYYQKSSQ